MWRETHTEKRELIIMQNSESQRWPRTMQHKEFVYLLSLCCVWMCTNMFENEKFHARVIFNVFTITSALDYIVAITIE